MMDNLIIENYQCRPGGAARRRAVRVGAPPRPPGGPPLFRRAASLARGGAIGAARGEGRPGGLMTTASVAATGGSRHGTAPRRARRLPAARPPHSAVTPPLPDPSPASAGPLRWRRRQAARGSRAGPGGALFSWSKNAPWVIYPSDSVREAAERKEMTRTD